MDLKHEILSFGIPWPNHIFLSMKARKKEKKKKLCSTINQVDKIAYKIIKMITISCLLLQLYDETTWYPKTVLRHKSYPLKTMAHPSFFLVFRNAKTERKKKIE